MSEKYKKNVSISLKKKALPKLMGKSLNTTDARYTRDLKRSLDVLPGIRNKKVGWMIFQPTFDSFTSPAQRAKRYSIYGIL